MGLQIGFAQIEVRKFLDSSFAVDNSTLAILTPGDYDSADEIQSSISKDTTVLVTGAGSKIIYENPNPESGQIVLSFLNDDENPNLKRLEGYVFPDSKLTITGPKELRDYFDSPGLLLSEWQNMVEVIIKPLGADKLPVSANKWLTMERAVIQPNRNDSFSANPSKTELTITSVGGRDPGELALAVGAIDLSAPLDISAGATDKLVNLTIDGTLYSNINFGQSATTASSVITDAINNAVGQIIATVDGSGFLNITSFLLGGTVIVDDPSSGTSAFALVYNTGSPGDVVTGEQPRDIPIFRRGDVTA